MFAYKLTELFDPPAFVCVVSATNVRVVGPVSWRPAVPEPRFHVTAIPFVVVATDVAAYFVVNEDGVPTNRYVLEVGNEIVLLTAVPVKVTLTEFRDAPFAVGVNINDASASLADFERPEVAPSGDERNETAARKTFCVVAPATAPVLVVTAGKVITAVLPDVAPWATTVVVDNAA